MLEASDLKSANLVLGLGSTYAEVKFLAEDGADVVPGRNGSLLGLQLEEGADELRGQDLRSEAVQTRLHTRHARLRKNKMQKQQSKSVTS